ncbi:glycoside hydrolase family 16 protein [Ramaria rubella]|nr:glycoside hydrolase family 16 protein [Ramaria rubella]
MLPPTSILTTLSILAHILPALAQGITCNATSACPSSNPCCSEFGFCGTGSNFCMGGCDPLWSHTPTSCNPAPLCQSGTYTFANNSRIISNATLFDGNTTEYDWTVDKGNILNTNQNGGELGLTLTQTNGGTRISSTRYIHYGTVTTRMKTGRWGGVVTAFITMSNAKDEIDWEFPSNATTEGQTNFYWLGVPNYNNGQTIGNLTDTFANYHDYTIDWQPDTLTFLIDGKVDRTVSKSDMKDAYPSTPARVQISIWPAGINTSAPGTIQWAGGMINWNDPDYVAAGHFYTLIQSVTINCSDPAGSIFSGAQSYVYGANATVGSLEIPAVLVTNQTTINDAPGLAGVNNWKLLSSLVLSGCALLLWA